MKNKVISLKILGKEVPCTLYAVTQHRGFFTCSIVFGDMEILEEQWSPRELFSYECLYPRNSTLIFNITQKQYEKLMKVAFEKKV